MWLANTGRKSLLDLFARRNLFDLLSIENVTSIESNFKNKESIVLVWHEKPSRSFFFPDLICVPENMVRDFLAWALTYIPTFRPFTAFCRVIDIQSINEFSNFKYKLDRSTNFESIIIGTILGEILTHLSNNDIKRISPISIRNTLSYALANGFLLGHSIAINTDIINRWRRLQITARQPIRILKDNSILNVWRVIELLNHSFNQISSDSESDESLFLSASKNILAEGIISKDIWRIITNDNQNLKISNGLSKKTREERVVIFEQSCNFLEDNKLFSDQQSSFLCAYLASQISLGSMKYIDLIKPCLKRYPDILLWYGFINGLYLKPDIYNEENGIGWRIWRDLFSLTQISIKPKADISLDELEVISNADRPNFNFLTESHTHMTVELMPSVCSLILWPPPAQKGVQQLALFEDDVKYEKEIDPFLQLGETLEKAKVLYSECSKLKNNKRKPHKKKKQRKER